MNVEEELRYLNEDLDSADLANDLIADEATKKIYQAIESLPGQCKAIFKLLYFEQATTKEAALKLGLTERNVLNQKARAIQLLRGILTGCLIIFYNFLLELPDSSLML
jgi:RNA polymerase sigma-70 factor (ECF subfamily)